jgi:hypothetical protein
VSRGPVAARRLDGARLDVAVGPLLSPVLLRLVGAYAARAELPLDRVDDAVLLAEALAAAVASESDTGRAALRVDSAPRTLRLRVGPLRAGAGERLVAAAHAREAGDVLRVLADRVRVTDRGRSGEYLVIDFNADPEGPR